MIPNKSKLGVYEKYIVKRTDGKDGPGERHAECSYFVLDLTHDPFAIPAIKAYAQACEDQYPILSEQLEHFAVHRCYAPLHCPVCGEEMCRCP
jgi:hypothetical protein